MAAPITSPAIALSCNQISKTFGKNKALDAVSFEVETGTIHALVGENGAGKSTLMNIVSGLLKPDAGAISIFGKEAAFASPLDASAVGIGMVHQHFMLVDAMTVAENLALGQQRSPFGLHFDNKKQEQSVSALAAETGLTIDPTERVENLPVGLRQRVEILKALSRGARILLLDEPTAVLAPPEVELLFATLNRLRDTGRTIVLITHKLDEVFQLASCVTVLRRGRSVFADRLSGLTPDKLAFEMVGEQTSEMVPRVTSSTEVSLDVKALSCFRDGRLKLDAINFQLMRGEILGIAGIEGNGQEELAGVLSGTIPATRDARVQMDSVDLLTLNIRSRTEAGVAFIPGDRQREGLVLEMSVAENLHLRSAYARGQSTEASRGLLLSNERMLEVAREQVKEFEVYPDDPELHAGGLSGGNQQKVVLARELSGGPRVIIAAHPTRGLDVSAAESVYQRLSRAAHQSGAGVLLISSDLDEILKLADRVAVLYQGKLTVLGPRGIQKAAVGKAMLGLTE